ncbi:hypothetical protein [Sphingomonas mucosissima]|uniref:Uncharacterized protein n=1 Tax=Sphingomonas mucosissima TaxID=370959 RepID=A0A245ZPW8_9SPHN|nr:hypothetical protein [Sphingomonas mucosissima]OWK31787.1 hypothetical protein SPMU_01050 [Sphingomonas mucosissima]
MPQNPWDLDWSTVKVTSGNGTGSRSSADGASSEDLKELRQASAKAEAERDARQTYAATRRAVLDMDTGPWKARMLDAITPDGDGGWADTIGGFLGTPIRALVPEKWMTARAALATNSARSTMTGANKLRGTASNMDTALARTATVNANKPVAENLRIIEEARRESELAQARAQFKSAWISKFGGMARTGPNGVPYEAALADAERRFSQAYGQSRRQLRTPPRSAMRGAKAPIEIDLNGNPVR